jgi:hypothetical protein
MMLSDKFTLEIYRMAHINQALVVQLTEYIYGAFRSLFEAVHTLLMEYRLINFDYRGYKASVNGFSSFPSFFISFFIAFYDFLLPASNIACMSR